MGTIVVTEFVSLDGVFEDPGGSEDYEYGGWTFEYDRGDEGNQFKLDELMDAKIQLLGRVTYEGFAAAWPSREGPFAEKLNNDLKVVVSTTLTGAGSGPLYLTFSGGSGALFDIDTFTIS